MTRPLPVIGHGGPVVVVTGHAAVFLEAFIDRGLRELRRTDALEVPSDVVDTIEALQVVAREYRRDAIAAPAPVVACSANGTSERSDRLEVRHSLVKNVNEVAARLQCSKRNVTALAGRGSLPALKSGRSWLFDRADVEAFAANRED